MNRDVLCSVEKLLCANIKMDNWPRLRIQRSKELQCEDIVKTEDGYMFVVEGQTNIYLVEINAAEWPPSCTCEDNYWRPQVLCKHIMCDLIGL